MGKTLWTPVEINPYYTDVYLVTAGKAGTNMCDVITIAMWLRHEKKWVIDNDGLTVKAWMELPEMYREKK